MSEQSMFWCKRLLSLTVLVLFTAILQGCSGETTAVAEGDPIVRRKQKDDAMERMLNPNGIPPKAIGKTKGRKGAKPNPADDMPLP